MKKFYVVWKGRTPGVYDNWDACKAEIDGFAGALYKGFPDEATANEAFEKGFAGFEKREKPKAEGQPSTLNPQPSTFKTPIIAVDAACSGNPGKMEYQGVFVDFSTQPASRKELFKSPVFPNATNNIGEFLALVHALALQKKNGWKYPIYSDSVNAQIWIRQKKCKTKLQPNAKNEHLFELIARAEKWLAENAVEVPILKWKTEIWGEIPADYGRK